jgi:hypothetical protein
MGMTAFSVYSRAADLGNGIAWYTIIGVSAAALTIAAAAVASWQGEAAGQAMPLGLAAVLAVLHSLATMQAAPTNCSQRDRRQILMLYYS